MLQEAFTTSDLQQWMKSGKALKVSHATSVKLPH